MPITAVDGLIFSVSFFLVPAIAIWIVYVACDR